jgi:RNA recognition motif-containing protein
MLQRVFAEYGTLLDAQVMWNTKLLAKGKRVNREFAFISFVTPEEAANAIRWLNGRFIEGITKDRDGLTVQYEAQGVGKSSVSQGHQPPPHLQQIINPAGAAQQTEQQMMLQQLQQQQQQQQGALELLMQQQQQQQWPHTGELALLQQLGLGQQELGQQQQGGPCVGGVIFEDSTVGGAAAPTPSSAPPVAQAGQGM